MLISAIFVLVAAAVVATMPHLFIHRFSYYPMTFMPIFVPAILIVIGVVGLIISVLALYFSLRLRGLSDVGAVHSTGIVLLILAIIGLFVANGFFIGFILLLIGSILALTWKP